MIQMPCPEMIYAGILRQPQTREQYDNQRYRKLCRKIAKEIVNQIQEYSECKIKTVFVVGIDGSPSCGVKEIDCNEDGQKVKKCGILIEELQLALKKKQIEVPFYGIHHSSLKNDLAELKKQIASKM